MDIQEWVDDMQVEAPSCLEVTMLRAVSFAIQEFFEESEAWVYKASVDVEADVEEYLLTLPTNTYVFANRKADVHYPTHKDKLKSTLLSDLPERSTGDPEFFCAEDDVLHLDSVQRSAVCKVELTLKPTHEILEVPDALATKYFKAIRSGALASLKRMSDKDWTDTKGAADHEQTFRMGIAKAKRESKKLRSRVRRPAKFNKGFAW